MSEGRLPEKSDAVMAEHEELPGERDAADLYHLVMKESKEDLKTEGVDVANMYRMGKQQQFKRVFRLSTMIMFTSMIQATWECILMAPYIGLVNGGLAGMFWSYIWTFAGFVTIVMSLAEMASMAPTSGGQYHWVSEFAPRKYQKFLSYMSGWMATTSWQAGGAGGTYLVGTVIQGSIQAYNPNYVPQRWQGTLFVFAVALIEGAVNSLCVDSLPRIQKVMVFPHGLGWMAVVVVLWVLAPHASVRDVFLNVSSNGGWEPIGISVMVGQITSVYFLILSDSAAHLAEEVKMAARSVPQAMMWSFFLNASVGLIVLVTFLFAIPDLNAALSSPTGYPFIYVFQQATYSGTIPLLVIIVSVALTGSVDANASTSRQTFAFARDGGLPGGEFLSRVTTFHHQKVPRNAVLFTCTVTCLLALVNLGSSIAFNAIISLQLSALMATYSISIGCVWYQRTLGGGQQLPPAQWSLGRYGSLVNGIAFVYSVVVFFWCFWPPASQVTMETFNWGSVMFIGVFVLSLAYYAVWGRHTYKGPVVLVRSL